MEYIIEGITNEKFLIHHAKHPQIYEKFKELALITKNKGFKTYSAAGIRELVRWHTAVGSYDPYKISNNFTPLYARLIMNNVPELRGFFKTKKAKLD